jgi:hypothetical protein
MKDSTLNNTAGPNSEILEVAKMMTDNKKFQRKIAAEARKYDMEKYQKMINEQYGKHNTWFYIDN